jgi:hypothetical protein
MLKNLIPCVVLSALANGACGDVVVPPTEGAGPVAPAGAMADAAGQDGADSTPAPAPDGSDGAASAAERTADGGVPSATREPADEVAAADAPLTVWQAGGTLLSGGGFTLRGALQPVPLGLVLSDGDTALTVGGTL